MILETGFVSPVAFGEMKNCFFGRIEQELQKGRRICGEVKYLSTQHNLSIQQGKEEWSGKLEKNSKLGIYLDQDMGKKGWKYFGDQTNVQLCSSQVDKGKSDNLSEKFLVENFLGENFFK